MKGAEPTAVLELEALEKSFPLRSRSGRRTFQTVLNGASLTLAPGEVLGLVGASGSGKSTLARCATRLLEPTAGKVIFKGKDISRLSARQLRPIRQRMGFVFQAPGRSLNPRQSVLDIVTTPLLARRVESRSERQHQAAQALDDVGLALDHMHRLPGDLSGGEQQRVSLARALIGKPELLVCDEAVTSLDVLSQARIIDLLTARRQELGFACIFISHDLELVRGFSNRVLTMRDGQVFELNHGAKEDRWPTGSR